MLLLSLRANYATAKQSPFMRLPRRGVYPELARLANALAKLVEGLLAMTSNYFCTLILNASCIFFSMLNSLGNFSNNC